MNSNPVAELAIKNESHGISKVSTVPPSMLIVLGVPAAVGAAPDRAVAAAAVRPHENRCSAVARLTTRKEYTPPAFWVATCVAVAAIRTVGPVGLKTVSIDIKVPYFPSAQAFISRL